MHKGVMLIVKAEDKVSAEKQANSFMEGFQNQVWDWYEVGGRWEGTLSKSSNVVPLAKCIKVVKDWADDMPDRIKEYEQRAKEEKGKDKGMYGYYLKKQGELIGEDFCFDCNVYNTEDWDYSIPEDMADYFAVMIDMHN